MPRMDPPDVIAFSLAGREIGPGRPAFLIGEVAQSHDGSLGMDPSSPASAAALQMRIIEAQEAERSRLAQEIHDGPAQALTNAIFQVQYVDRLLDQDPVVAGVELRYLGELLRRELSDVRSYISQLRPPLLDQLGLEGAIRDTVEHIAALSELQIRCDLGASGEHLEPERAAAGEEVEAAAAGYLRHQPVEQRLADAVRRRPDAARARKPDAPPPPFAADDAQGVGHFLQRTSLKLAR